MALARLIVEALATDYAEPAGTTDVITINVSVSDTRTGRPICGLEKSHFSIIPIAGTLGPIRVDNVFESPLDSGFYHISVSRAFGATDKLPSGMHILGIQVHRPAAAPARSAGDSGQTVARVQVR
jgi:hypothetical protein